MTQTEPTLEEQYLERVREALREIFDDLHEEDWWIQASLPVELITLLKDTYVSEAATMRRSAMRELRSQYSAQEIADKLGIGRARVIQIVNK